jgi:hypothetical protein
MLGGVRDCRQVIQLVGDLACSEAPIAGRVRT